MEKGLVKNIFTGQQVSKNFFVYMCCVAVGVCIWVVPPPNGLDIRAWKTFGLFSYTILGMIFKPVPVGVIALSSLVSITFFEILTFNEAFGGFSNSTVWLIVTAFFIARGFIKTGLGLRIAYKLMGLLGNTTLGIAYGVVLTDWILSCAIPSVTARAGGIIYPIVASVSQAFGSEASCSRKKLGAYLIQTVFQCGAITSAMFLTGMAGNPMVQAFAAQVGVELSWGTWALAAFVPGVCCLVCIPMLLYRIYPPEIKNTPFAKALAKENTWKLGKMSYNEWAMLLVFSFMITLWMLAPVLHVNPTVTALLGLCLLIGAGVLSWTEVLQEKSAWDILVWFSALLAIADAMGRYGLMTWFSQEIGMYLEGVHWTLSFFLIAILYYYSHYLFASNIAHITSMYPPFLCLSIAVGAPAMLAALLLGFFSSIFGSLTTYGCGPAPIFFGAGYVTIKEWLRLGFIISLVNIFIWLTVGSIWWYLLGLYTF